MNLSAPPRSAWPTIGRSERLRPTEGQATRPSPSVSIVVCTYTEDRFDILCEALNSLHRQTRRPDEIVVVVDHCPAVRDRLDAPCWPDPPNVDGAIPMLVVENDESQGLSNARNKGVSVAGSQIVAFLDDDAVAEPQWLEELLEPYGERSTVGVGGQVRPAWMSGRPGWFPHEFDWVVGCSHSGMPQSRATVRNFVGANMSFRRAGLELAGGFSSSLGRVGTNAAGCEETELCLRVASGGNALVYEPRAEVYHHVPRSRATWRYFIRRCYEEGRSKATVSVVANRSGVLGEERRYLSSTIPHGILRRLARPYRLSSWTQTLALIVGAAVTSLGYLGGSVEARNRHARAVQAAERTDPVGALATTEAPTTTPPGLKRSNLVGTAGFIAALALYVIAVTRPVPLGSMGGFGLITVLPITYWIGIGLLTLSFAVCVRTRPTRPILLALHVLLLIAYLHLTPAILYGTLRYAWAWKHVGMTDFIINAHHVNLHSSADPELVAYQDWPGFFALNAFLDSAGGLTTPLHYAAFAPAFNELLYAGPLMLIFRSFTTDPRVRWTALWIFYLGNWVGQDYFSPQAFAYFFYLVIIALYLNQFARYRSRQPAIATWQPPSWALGGAARGSPSGPSASLVRWTERHQQALLVGILGLFMLVVASTHQLTPFMVLSATVLLVLARRLAPKYLVLIVLVVTLGWIFFAARTFLDQNLHSIIQSIGDPLGNTTSALINLQNASPAQVVVARVDRLLTASVVVLAVIGWWRARNSVFAGRRWVPAVLLVAAPVAGLAANNYGGEMAFRVYLFALPMFAILGAGAFVPGLVRLSQRTLDVLRGLILGGLLAGTLVTYYGKEQANYFSPGEVQAMQKLFARAPVGSTFISASSNLPWGFTGFESYNYYFYSSDTPTAVRRIVNAPATTLANFMAKQRSAYLIFSSSDTALVTMTGLLPSGGLAHIESSVLQSGRFNVIEKEAGVTVLTVKHTRSASR